MGNACKKMLFKAMRLDENNIQSNVDNHRYKNRDIRSKDKHLEVEMVGNASKGV